MMEYGSENAPAPIVKTVFKTPDAGEISLDNETMTIMMSMMSMANHRTSHRTMGGAQTSQNCKPVIQPLTL